MNTEEEKIFQCCNELVVKIEEKFYMFDREFDSSNCSYILYMIGKMYIEKRMTLLFEKQMLEFIDKCLYEINSDYKFDYKILYNNLDYLLIDNLIFEENIRELKNRIDDHFENKESQEDNNYSEGNKRLVFSYVV